MKIIGRGGEGNHYQKTFLVEMTFREMQTILGFNSERDVPDAPADIKIAPHLNFANHLANDSWKIKDTLGNAIKWLETLKGFIETSRELAKKEDKNDNT